MNYNSLLCLSVFIGLLFAGSTSSVFAGNNKAHDDFNKSPVGLLDGSNGGKGWSGSWTVQNTGNPFEIEDIVTAEGRGAVRVTVSGAGYQPTAVRTFEPKTKGRLHFEIGKSGVDHAPAVVLYSGGAIAMAIAVGPDTQQTQRWYFQVGSEIVHLSPYILNTFESADVEFDTDSDRYRVSINKGSFTPWRSFIQPVSSIDTILLEGGSVGYGTSDMYWDDIRFKFK